MTDRVKNIVLVMLAVMALVASGLAVWTVNRPSAAKSTSRFPIVSDQTAATTEAVPTTEAKSEQGDAANETEEPTEAAPAPRAPDLEISDWGGSLEKPDANLLVIGDGYSNLPSQWIQEWGVLESTNREVNVRHWGEAQDMSFNPPFEFGTPDDRPLNIWSASRAESTVQDAVDRAQRFLEAADRPDAILITLGQASGDEDVSDALTALLEELPDVPILVTTGPQDLYQPGVAEDFLEWVEDHRSRAVALDLRQDVASSPTPDEWARAFQTAINSGS